MNGSVVAGSQVVPAARGWMATGSTGLMAGYISKDAGGGPEVLSSDGSSLPP